MPRRKRAVVLRDACFAAAIACALSALGSWRNTSTLDSELTATKGVLDKAEDALTEMNSLGYGAALVVEAFLRGYAGDFGGVFRRLDEEMAAHETMTEYNSTARLHMGQIAAKKEAAESQTVWSIVLVVLSISGGGYFALRARTPSPSTD